MTAHGGDAVTYVALGPSRLAAATAHTARLAADGAQVQLIVGDLPESAGLAPAPGVTVHRVPAPSSKAAARAATRLAAKLPPATLMIAGDLAALPVAWAATRRQPGLTVRLEPTAEPERRPAAADLAVVTPWYPSPNDPALGAFVRSSIRALGGAYERVSILHTQDWGFPRDLHIKTDRLELTHSRLTARWGNAVVADTPEGELTRVSAPVLTVGSFALRAEAQAKQLAAVLPTGKIEAPLIHAHTGIYGGVVATELARPGARIVVTEHAAFLRQVFAHNPSRRRYEQMLARVDLLMCVGKALYEEVRAQFPQHAAKLRVVPDVVDVDAFAVRPDPPKEPLRWLYLGPTAPDKGVPLLLDAFARVAAEEPRATLTVVGSGELDAEVRRRAAEPALAGRVELRPPVPPEAVAELMHEHDVLVHPSRRETFGLTVVEAVATGTPVLAARSNGPVETLAGVEALAGRMFNVSDDPAVLVEAYRALRAQMDTLDLARAREELRARYAPSVVGPALLEAYRAPVRKPAEKPAQRPEKQGRFVVFALDRSSPELLRDFVRSATNRGYEVDVVTAHGPTGSWISGYAGARVHSLEQAERGTLLLRVERLLVYRLPGKVISTGLRASQRTHALWPELAARVVRRRYRQAAAFVHLKLFEGGYGLVRPMALWRLTRRALLGKLDVAGADRVVIFGPTGITTGWRLARRHPNLTVTTSTAVPDDPGT